MLWSYPSLVRHSLEVPSTSGLITIIPSSPVSTCKGFTTFLTNIRVILLNNTLLRNYQVEPLNKVLYHTFCRLGSRMIYVFWQCVNILKDNKVQQKLNYFHVFHYFYMFSDEMGQNWPSYPMFIG